MDRRTTRQLAAILLVIAVILIGIKTLQPKSEAAEFPKKGFIEVKQDDYEQLQEEAVQWKAKYEELDKVKSAKKDKPLIKVMHLNINEGMSSKEVSKQMEKAGIIEDAEELNDYLSAEKWQQSIQIGDYELTSDMSLQQIAETITGNRSKKE